MREDEAGRRNRQRNRQRKYMRERKVRDNRENFTHLYLRPKERKGRRTLLLQAEREEKKYYVSRIRSKARDRETQGTGLSYEERR